MLKTIAFPLISLVLIFSVLAPSIMPLMDKDSAIVILMDNNEEEKSNEKESEKKFSEKDLFLNHFAVNGSFFIQSNESEDTGYLFLISDFKAEILLPPPENLG